MRRRLAQSREVALISRGFIGACTLLLLSAGPLSASIITVGQPAGQTRFEFKNTAAIAATDLHITLLSATPPTFADPPNQPQPSGEFGTEGFDRASVGQDFFGDPELTLDILGGTTTGVGSGDSFNLDFSDWPAGTKFDLQYSYPPPLPRLDGGIGLGEPELVVIEFVVLSLEPEPGTLMLLGLGGVVLVWRRRENRDVLKDRSLTGRD